MTEQEIYAWLESIKYPVFDGSRAKFKKIFRDRLRTRPKGMDVELAAALIEGCLTVAFTYSDICLSEVLSLRKEERESEE